MLLFFGVVEVGFLGELPQGPRATCCPNSPWMEFHRVALLGVIVELPQGPLLEDVDHRYAIFFIIYVTFIVFAVADLHLRKTKHVGSSSLESIDLD